MAFVTVGSTRFDKLIDSILSEDFLSQLVSQGFVRLVVQAGASSVDMDLVEMFRENYNMDIEVFDYKQSIQEDIERADLIIGHAGAGTCLEVLRANKRLLLVINDSLMDNHQSELANELASKNYVIQTTIDQLGKNFDVICNAKLEQFPQKDASKFEEIFDDALKKASSRL